MNMKQHNISCIIRILLMLVICLTSEIVRGEEVALPLEQRAPDRFAVSLDLGNTYDPSTDISFALIKGFGLFDYGKVWHQDSPRELCFKVEGGFGSTFRTEARTIASLGMLALYYVERMASSHIRPYVEGGIGIIYTDFRVEGQGLRFNFNPQMGVGAELLQKDGPGSFVALRLHHLSNGNLYHDNRGVSSIVLQIGSFF